MITDEARELLAQEYISEGKWWFAHIARNNKFKQFDTALRVITKVLARAD